MKTCILIAILGLALTPCFAEEQWDGYRIGDVYEDSTGDIGIVTAVYEDGLRYNMGLYEDRKKREAEREAEREELERKELRMREIEALERIAEAQ